MVDFDVEYCPHCGNELNYVAGTCPYCGADVPEGADYCPDCGELMEQGFYVCGRCLEEITESEVDAFNAMPAEEQAKHIHRLNKAFEEKEEQLEMEREEREKQREIERKESRRIQAQAEKEKADLIKQVEALLAGKVTTTKSVKITSAWIETSFIKDGDYYKLTVPRKSWDVALLRLIDSLDQLPSDVECYKLERWS